MIDRYLIRYFLAVVEQGNFSRAAAHCNVSQPTLSVGIAKLEKIAGHQLFMRTNQRVELTEAGSRFLPHGRRIEREFNAAMAMLNDIPAEHAARPIRVGMLHSLPAAIAADAGRTFRSSQPGPVEFVFASERELLGRLTRGRLDAIVTIMRATIDEFFGQEIMQEGYAMVLPHHHPLADRDLLTADLLERGVRPHFSLRTTNDEHALSFVEAGLGITIMPDCFRRDSVRHVPLAGFHSQRTLGFYVADRGLADHPLLSAIALALRSRSR
jgi:DNA-binding transcriptional LysR family regulator